MYTRCPTCSTCFRVTDRHLAIAKGKVRCGQCQLVFNAPEHAIDDLPVNKTPAKPAEPKAEFKKPVEVETTPVAPKTKIKKPVKVDATPAKVKTPLIDKSDAEIQEIIKPATPIKEKETKAKPEFDADATMIADTKTLPLSDLDDINLDKPSSAPEDISILDDDEIFDDSFDLNAAIDELTQATDKINEADNGTTEESNTEIAEKDKSTPVANNSGDVFTTDAYDATNAASVADILNEMEGQLSLDISEPEVEKNYDANDEFEFLELDDELDNPTIKNKEPTEANHTENEQEINEEELFDQIDLSDLESHHEKESRIEEDIVIEDVAQQNIGQHAPEKDIPFQLRNDIENLQATSPRRLHPLLSVLLIIILLGLSLTQIAYFRAHELVSLIPASRPLLESFCEKVTCHYSGPRDTKKIQLISRDVRLHPKEKKALLISAAMINNANFAQPYPKIHIRLSDISGNVIAERVFNSKTYLGKLSNPFLLMKPKTPVHINFEVVDPGKDAINFEFTFL